MAKVASVLVTALVAYTVTVVGLVVWMGMNLHHIIGDELPPYDDDYDL